MLKAYIKNAQALPPECVLKLRSRKCGTALETIAIVH